MKSNWVDKASSYLGDCHDGVYFAVEAKGSKFGVKAWVDSKTGCFTADLENDDVYDTYAGAMTAGVCMCLEWCMANGVWVSGKSILAVKAKKP